MSISSKSYAPILQKNKSGEREKKRSLSNMKGGSKLKLSNNSAITAINSKN